MLSFLSLLTNTLPGPSYDLMALYKSVYYYYYNKLPVCQYRFLYFFHPVVQQHNRKKLNSCTTTPLLMCHA